MEFTKHEQSVILELEKRAGDVLYIQDIAPFFISNSCLQISTYTQTAYIQVGDNMQTALSEYFQLIVFIKKLEQNGACFSIPYTPLKDNLVQIGNPDFEEYQQHTIADGDLLVQLFQYAGKKYVMAPKFSHQFKDSVTLTPITKQNKVNFIIPSFILLLLFLFIGGISYQSYEDRNQLQLKQDAINTDLIKQTENIKLISSQLQNQTELQSQAHENTKKDIASIHNIIEKQNVSLKSIKYWNYRQSKQLENLQALFVKDSSASE